MAGLLDRFAVRIAARDGGFFCAYCGIELASLPKNKHPECWTWQTDDPRGAGYVINTDYAYPTIDHRIPLARGGTNTLDNVCLACDECNNFKNDLTPHEWYLVKYCGRSRTEFVPHRWDHVRGRQSK